MALLASGRDMLSRQRELRVVVVKRRIPVASRMARLAGRRELRRLVIRISRAVVIGQVTTDASGR